MAIDNEKKLVNLSTLERLARLLDERRENDVELLTSMVLNIDELKAEKEDLTRIEEMLGGKSLRYVTQEEYDELSETDKSNDAIAWIIMSEDGALGGDSEVISNLGDLVSYAFDELQTEDKTVIGAVNELESDLFKTKADIIALDTYKADIEYVDAKFAEIGSTGGTGGTGGGTSTKLKYTDYIAYETFTENLLYVHEPYSTEPISYLQVNSNLLIEGETDYKFIITTASGKHYVSKLEFFNYGEGAQIFEAYYENEPHMFGGYSGLGFKANSDGSFNLGSNANTAVLMFYSSYVNFELDPIVKFEAATIGQVEVNDEFLATNRFVTEYEKTYWDNKANKTYYTTESHIHTVSGITYAGRNSVETGTIFHRYTAAPFEEDDFITSSTPYGTNGIYRLTIKDTSGNVSVVTDVSKYYFGGEVPFYYKSIILDNGSDVYIEVYPQGRYESGSIVADPNTCTIDIQYSSEYGEIRLSEIKIESIIKEEVNDDFFKKHRFGDSLNKIKPQGNVLNLTTEKRQKVDNMANNTEIILPAVSDFTEIHLYFTAQSDLTLIFPAGKYQKTPEIKANKTYEFIFTYVDEWLIGFVEYGN